jgi:hypothetical protein
MDGMPYLDIIHEEGVECAVSTGLALERPLNLLNEGHQLVEDESDVVRIGLADQNLLLLLPPSSSLLAHVLLQVVAHAQGSRGAVEPEQGRPFGPGCLAPAQMSNFEIYTSRMTRRKHQYRYRYSIDTGIQ